MNSHTNHPSAQALQDEGCWKAVCAKLGQPDAMYVRAGGTLEECHDKRKNVRRAVNAIVLATSGRDTTEEEASAMAHAATLVARLDSFIDGFVEARAPGSDDAKALRTAEDFKAHYSARGTGDGGSFSIKDFLRGVSGMGVTASVRNALSTGTDTAGGFTVPSILMPGILGAMAPASSLLQAGAGIIPLEQGMKSATFAGINTIPTAAWRSENGSVAESDPVFRAVTATPKSLSFMFKVSRELLADGQNLTAAIYAAIGQSFAKELDRAGLRGSGSAPEPLGLRGTSGVQAVTNGTNGAALAGYTNFMSAVQGILAADCPMPTAAIMAPRSLVKLGGLEDSTGQPKNRPPMLGDMNLIATSQIPVNLTVGTSTDCSEIYIGDFSNMLFTMRENVSIQPLNELFAGTGQVGFACHMRVDVAVLYPAAFALVTGVRA